MERLSDISIVKCSGGLGEGKRKPHGLGMNKKGEEVKQEVWREHSALGEVNSRIGLLHESLGRESVLLDPQKSEELYEVAWGDMRRA